MKTQHRHLIILLALLFFGFSAHAHVFLDPRPGHGNNSNSGADSDHPVSTLAGAKTRIKEQMDDDPTARPWVILMGSTLTVSSGINWTGTIDGHDDWVIHIKRIYGSIKYSGPIITVASGGKLTLKDIVVDGTGYGNGGGCIYKTGGVDALIYLEAESELIIKDGTILQNNHRLKAANTPNDELTTCGGAIEGVRAKVTMIGGQITNCKADKLGGGIYLYSEGATSDETTSSFTMTGGEIDHCEAFASQAGGGAYINGVNRSSGSAGNRVWYAQVTLTKGKIHDNCAAINGGPSANGRGAGIHCARSKVYMNGDEMEIYNNQAKYFGGGIQIGQGSIFYFSKGKIYNNTAYNSTVSEISSVSSGGGGIHIGYGLDFDSHTDTVPSEMIMTGGEVYGNTALNGYGGGIHTSNMSELNISGGKIYNNEARFGGGINLQCPRKLEFDDDATVEVYGNTAKSGGGIAIDGAPLIVRAGSFYNNVADGTGLLDEFGKGGAFYVHTDNTGCKKVASVEMYGGSIYNNSASYDGGGIYIREPRTSGLTDKRSQVLIQGGLLEGNSAGHRGGGIYVFTGDVILQGGASIINNTAGDIGGGILFDQSSHLTMGAGDINVKDNMANSKPDNIYLFQKDGANNPKTISIAEDVTFNPRYVGIYTQKRTANIPVFTGTNDQLTTIYDGMKSGDLHIYDDSQMFSPLDPGSGNILYFGSNPWSVLQQQTTTVDLHEVGDVYEISNVKELTAFLCHVNGISPNATSFGSGDPTANGKLTADIDMDGHYWVPISTGYTGTFDGNGYTISHLTMVATNISPGRGMFGTTNSLGTIKNVILKDCYFGSSTASTNLGGIVSSNGGTVSNSVVDGTFYVSVNTCVIGGIAGVNSGTVHSCYAAPDMTGYQMGGLVGSNSGNLYNSFANASFDYKGGSKYCGGLVGVNTGSVENCYSRVQGSAPASYFGWLVGSNTGTGLKYCYIPVGETPFKRYGDVPSGHCWYSSTALPVLYDHSDNQMSFPSGVVNDYVPEGSNKQLLATLNNWVTAENKVTPEHTPRAVCTYWLRPWQKDDDSKFINDDLPILRLPATNAVAATNGDAYLDYNQVNDLLGAYTTANDAVCFYGQEASMNGNESSAATLYIDQDAVLKQSGTGGAINAYVGVALQNLKSAHYQWHMFSTALQNVPLGVNYTNNNEYEFGWEHPSGMPYWRFYEEGNANHGYFPSMTYAYGSENAYNGSNADATSYGNYYYDWDYYCYSEPDYHWINFKRNSASHWHEDDEGATNIPYTNETYLGVGKGYFLSVKENTYLQAHGTLNNGALGSTTPNIYKVTVTDGITWTNREGFNLVGNPYQSYLNFNAFATENKDLWGGNQSKAYYYIIDGNAYTKYAYNASKNTKAAPLMIHPHQGFFIVADNAAAGGTALLFNDGMREVDGRDVTFRDSEQPAYPLVNLIVTDDEDKSDIATVELGRPDKGGAKLMDNMRVGKGIVYCHYEDEDYAIAFTQPGLSEASIRFETAEDAPFTMTWDTENGDFQYLHLIDNMTGTDIDCLTKDEYKFTAKTTDYKSRFRLVFGYTGIDEPEAPEPVEGPASFAFMMGDELVVNGEGRLQLFDMSGRMLMETQVEGTQSTLGLPELASGVYLLRLGDRINGTRTQKIVIR